MAVQSTVSARFYLSCLLGFCKQRCSVELFLSPVLAAAHYLALLHAPLVFDFVLKVIFEAIFEGMIGITLM